MSAFFCSYFEFCYLKSFSPLSLFVCLENKSISRIYERSHFVVQLSIWRRKLFVVALPDTILVVSFSVAVLSSKTNMDVFLLCSGLVEFRCIDL